MNNFFKSFMKEKFDEEERLFYLASATSCLATVVFLMIGTLFKVNLNAVILCVSYVIFCFVLILLENKLKKTEFFSYVLLIVTNIIGFPIGLLFSEKNTAEFPVYFLVGVVFSMVLLKGYKRVIYMSVQICVDISIMYYVFIVRKPYEEYYGLLDEVEYVKLAMAIIITGTLCGIMITYRNLVIDKEIAMREDATQEAEEVSYAKDMFLVNVSHEIRTPLNAIIGTTDVILDSDASNHLKEMAFNISNSSHALLSITSDLLDFSRMNTDTVKTVEEKYDLAFMLSDVINLMSVRLLDSNVDFFVNIDPFIPKMLIGDCIKIRQIIVNLLSNAIKYTKEGHMAIDVSFDYVDRETIELKIDVSDTGIGIKPEMLDKIFIPYNRSGKVETDRMIEGNGLGLAFCKTICAAMGGSLTVESEYAKGSTFHFKINQRMEIPYVGGYCGGLKFDENSIVFFANGNKEIKGLKKILDDMEVVNRETLTVDEFITLCSQNEFEYYLIDAKAYEKNKSEIVREIKDIKKLVVISKSNYSYSDEAFEYVLTRPISCLNVADLLNKTVSYAMRKQVYEGNFTIPEATVLIIDDNLVNLEVAKNLLSRYKCRVLTAASGKEGLIVLEKEKADIVFLDYMMPDMDGIDTLKCIRKLPDENVSKLPVITLTANVVSGAREMFLNAGFDDYLSKPIETDKMERMLMEYLPDDLIIIKAEEESEG